MNENGKTTEETPWAEPETNASGTDAGPQNTDDASADSAAADQSPEGGSSSEEIEALKAENAELRDKLLRTVADMENLRRRTDREKQDAGKYAISKFAGDVLSVGDNLTRALTSINDEARAAGGESLKTLIEGVEMTERELQNVLSRHGIARLDPKGEKFDPNVHQAMFEIENPDVPSGTVVEVVQAGYVIAERCLRPALVGVSKGGAKAAPAKADSAAETDVAQDTQAYSESAETTQPETSSGHTVDKSA